MTIDFGKYRGRDITDVPQDYLEWMRDSNRNLLEAVQNEIERRAIGAERERLDQARQRLEEEQESLARERKAYEKERKKWQDAAAELRHEREIAESRRQHAQENTGVAAELLKAGFRALSKQRHPDAGGTHEAMVELKSVFDYLMESVR